MFGGYPIPEIRVVDPAWGIWRPYSGDLDTDHAYKAWGRISLSYYGCHATVDQHIELGSGQPAPRTHWIGTATKCDTHTDDWLVIHWQDNQQDDPVPLSVAVSEGWISENMAYFDNITGNEVAFTVGEGEEGALIDAWNGVKIQVLTSDKLALVIPR